MGNDYDPNSLNHALGRIEANQRSMAEELQEHRKETRAGFEGISKRTSDLETFNTVLKAKLAVASAAISAVVAVGWELLKNAFTGNHKP